MSHLTIETISTGTIPQIKEWCKINGLSYPYKLKKAEAIEYLKTEYNKKVGFNNDTAVSTIPQNVSNKINVDTLDKFTINEIKTWCNENGIKYPHKLKKDEAISQIKAEHNKKKVDIK